MNGECVAAPVNAGLVGSDRQWRTGDTVELRVPFALRLERLPGHPETAALLWGPRVLFALRAPEDLIAPLIMKESGLLGAERTGEVEWRVGNRVFTSWTAVGERAYSTYVRTV